MVLRLSTKPFNIVIAALFLRKACMLLAFHDFISSLFPSFYVMINDHPFQTGAVQAFEGALFLVVMPGLPTCFQKHPTLE